jgi:filamentous hemagglutinin family protein
MKNLCIGLFVLTSSLTALPKDPQIVSGKAQLNTIQSNQLNITTGDKTIIHWSDFSIDQNEYVEFSQPFSTSAVLNRITGESPSHILGHLYSNGKVYLINPNGVIFGKEAIIQTSDFLASTLDSSNDTFLLNHEHLFQGDSEEAIINYGMIKALDGNVTIIARLLENKGTLLAPLGKVSLAAGQEVLINFEESPLLTIRASLNPKGKIIHSGKIESLIAELQSEGQAHTYGINLEGTVHALNTVEQGGEIYLKSDSIVITSSGELTAPYGSIEMESTKKAIYNEGTVVAEGGKLSINNSSPTAYLYNLGTFDVSSKGGGKIEINTSNLTNCGSILANGNLVDGGKITINAIGPYIETVNGLISTNGKQAGGAISLHSDDSIFSSGTLSSQGQKAGGEISLSAPSLTLVSAVIDASSTSQGGKIFIGGGPHGEKRTFPNAKMVRLSGDTHLSTSTSLSGNGGTIVVWSDDKTICYGSIEAKGGLNGGDGGWIEVSGNEDLYCEASICANAPNGSPGSLLLDPKNVTIESAALFPQYEFLPPGGTSGGSFGKIVVPLSTGNVVITRPNESTAVTNAGAVYLYNGATGALISTITGSTSGDLVGKDGIIALSNGNFVIRSLSWINSGVIGCGAVTWGSGTTGVSGVVSDTNSLVGTQLNDQIGLDGVTALSGNGNYVVGSRNWDDGGTTNVGAVTWGDGTTGTSGSVSPSNSLTGSTASDLVGNNGVTALTNGNYVVGSSGWDGAATNTGAATWVNGSNGYPKGESSLGVAVSSSNSLVGSTLSDFVGQTITSLTNGHYVVVSPQWNGGSTDLGAATFCDGTTGRSGAVSSSNSLVGTSANDAVGSNGIVELTTGNYVVINSFWNNGAFSDAGAVTWVDGSNGYPYGEVSPGAPVSTSNSLVGGIGSAAVGVSGVTPLTNGNYVVKSVAWDEGIPAGRGAATLCQSDGSTTETVSSANSVVGSEANDFVGENVICLSNGNYVVVSKVWKGGGISRGAVTWGDGINGTTGVVSSSNSLVGSTDNDGVGNEVTSLTNGNYVVASPQWDNGGTANVGAVTWGDGSTGTSGFVSPSNSLIGSTASDSVGNNGATALTNGNYVVRTNIWDGAAVNTGAVTWVNGANGYPKGESSLGVAVSSSNSLVGSELNDGVGNKNVLALTNGNYVVVSTGWNGGSTDLGAVTFCDGTTGRSGPVTSSNSLVGTTTGDFVGGNNVVEMTSGNYAVSSPIWDNGASVNAGAVTFGSSLTGVVGPINNQNSLIGATSNAGLTGNDNTIIDSVNNTFLGRFFTEGDGVVRAGLGSPNALTYSSVAGENRSVGPSFLTGTLNSGTDVSVEANNNLTVTNSITGSSAGTLTLRAGRSIVINSDITTDNDLTIIANDLLANGVVDIDREAGNALISIADGVTINTGSGNMTLSLLDGAGKTNSESGTLTIGNNITLQCTGTGSLTILAEVNDVEIEGTAELTTDVGSLNITAGNDLTISNSNTSSSTGAITLRAGKSVHISSDLSTDNNLTITANDDLLAKGVTDVGLNAVTSDISIANGVTIDAGTGNLSITLLGVTGETNFESGNLTIGDNATLQSSGSGSIIIEAEVNDVEIGDLAQLTTVDGDLSISAGRDILISN